MGLRVSEDDVLDILGTTTLEKKDIRPHLQAANLVVTEHLASEGLSANVLAEIERWLAAHFAVVEDPRVEEESAGGQRFRYEGKTGTGLDGTRYGQRVKMLDPTGNLASAAEDRKPFRYRAGAGFKVENP